MEPGMKTNIQDLLLERLWLPISCLHAYIVNISQVLDLEYFNDLKVKKGSRR